MRFVRLKLNSLVYEEFGICKYTDLQKCLGISYYLSEISRDCSAVLQYPDFPIRIIRHAYNLSDSGTGWFGQILTAQANKMKQLYFSSKLRHKF